MKANKRIIALAATATVAGVILYILQHRKKHRQMERVANEGYETAHDVLFPHPGQRRRKKQYGQEYTL